MALAEADLKVGVYARNLLGVETLERDRIDCRSIGIEVIDGEDRNMASVEDLATTLSVLTGLIACLAFVAATGPGSRLIILVILAGSRLRTVVRAATHSGLIAKRTTVYSCVRQIAKAQYTGAPYNLALEMEWLCQLYAVSLPITMTISQKDLECLSIGYQQLAGRCRARLLFGAKGNDVVAKQASVADQAARLLQEHSLHAVHDNSLPAEIIDLRPQGSYIRLMHAEASMDCIVSPHPSRQPSIPAALHEAAPAAKPRFEGILPFLLRHQMELDSGSGRTLLHLGIGEIPYSNLLSRNTSWDSKRLEPPESVGQHAVSLAVLPVTSDGRVLLSRRASAAGSYAGMIGPYITGNAELRDRRGLAADRDEFGIPDLLKAACREGAEEVGLPLNQHELRILGLAQIWSPEDTGIFTLLLSAALPMRAAKVAELTRHSDPVEGGWEVGNELYAVALWEDDKSVQEVLHWIASDKEIAPQTVACLAALAYKTSLIRVVNWREIADSPSRRPDRLIKVLSTHRPYR